MAVRSDVTFDDNFVDLRDGSWTVDLKYLSFEKAMPEKDKSCKRKRPAVSGSRTDFCATPPFAKVVASSKIQSLYESLEKAGKANLLAQTLKGNEFKPCDFFEHSGNPAQESAPSSNFMEMSYDIFKNMHAEMDSSLFAKATSASIAHNVGVTLQDIKVIEKETRKQASSHRWFLERSKRLTSSLFGRILRRRENVFPKSILDQIAKRGDGTGPNTAGLQWGIEKEKVALERYKTEFCHQGNSSKLICLVVRINCLRRVLGITWKQKITNVEVEQRIRQLIGNYGPLLVTARRRKLQWFGHITRQNGTLAHDIMHGAVESSRGRGRPRNTWLSDIANWTGKSVVSCMRVAKDRGRWRKTVNSSKCPNLQRATGLLNLTPVLFQSSCLGQGMLLREVKPKEATVDSHIESFGPNEKSQEHLVDQEICWSIDLKDLPNFT
eukprot:gene7414-13169_t